MRGVLRVRKWPRKRGTPKSALQRWWIDWFKQANKLTKYASAYDQQRAIEITKNSGMYPRDIMLAAMRGRLYIWQDQTGKVWYPMAGIQDISESLDVIAQSVGDILTRATDRWRAVAPGNPGDVLTNQGASLPAAWAPVAGAGGFGGGCVAYRSSTTSIPNASFTAVPFNAELYDTAGIHESVTNPTRMTVPVGATWARATFYNEYSTNTTGIRINRLHLNGALAIGCAQQQVPAVGHSWSRVSVVSAWIPVVAGDYFEALLYQNSGSARNAGGTTNACVFSLEIA